MLTSLDPLKLPTPEERALSVLKGKDNPFEALVSVRQADERFDDLHVPALHSQARELLLQMIDTYRLPDYNDTESLPKTRVVTIQGARGSGKTHLLHSLVARPDLKPQVIVRPAFFEPTVSVEEYLLTQLRTALAQKSEFGTERPLEAIARGLTRPSLRQSLLGAGPADRLNALQSGGGAGFRFLWGGADVPLRRLERLAEKLKDSSSSLNLPELVRLNDLTPESACRLVCGHLKARESAADPLVAMRQLFYIALARFALLDDRQAIPQFLTEDYRKADPSGTVLRLDLVHHQLLLLVEACTLVRMPIVFAFDNLERLLAPLNRYEGEFIQKVLRGLAQAVDNTRGLLFLLFAESGLLAEQIAPNTDDYVRLRLEQGVPVSGRGSVFMVKLKEPTDAEVLQLVQGRVRPLLSDLQELSKLPPSFPFTTEFLATVTGAGSVSLRNILVYLRDEYDRVVNAANQVDTGDKEGTNSVTTTTSQEQGHKDERDTTKTVGTDWPALLESSWNRSLQRARSLVESLSRRDLHNCIGRALSACLPLSVDGWDLVNVEPVVPVGQNPDYGHVTLLDWKPRDGEVVKGPQSLRVAVGLLLAGGPGLPHDLRAKFAYFDERVRGVRLVILWQTLREDEVLVDALPPGTRVVWDEVEAHHRRTELRRISELDLRRILAYQDLLTNVEDALGQAPPPDVVRSVLLRRLDHIFPLFRPPVAE